MPTKELSRYCNRYAVHLSVDKPIYRHGDTVYIRGIILRYDNNLPFALIKDCIIRPKLKIIGPKGDTIVTTALNEPEYSVISYAWQVGTNVVGGEYTIKISFAYKEIATAERKIEIRAFQNPRLNTQMEFIKKAYGIGETALATLTVTRAEGGFPKGAKVSATALVDGKEVYRGDYQLNEKGFCIIKCPLPKEIEVGEGTLTCVINDGGVIETASKTIPIILQKMDVKIYPEGGYLIAGIECGVYIEAFTPFGDPADLSGDICDENGNIVAEITTRHEGRGKCYFTPQKDKKYHLKITKPSGVTKTVPFMEIKDEGVSLRSQEEVYECDEPIKLKLTSTKKGIFYVGIYKKEIELVRTKAKIQEDFGSVDINLALPSSTQADGVLRVMVYDETFVPVAERLIFRKPLEKLQIQIVTDYKHYSPGDKVNLKLLVTDSKGKAVPRALVALTVTDESVLEMVEKRKRAPRLPEMVLLEHEVNNLEDANIYLSNDPRAEMAVDLLLGTQGWRRFVYQDITKFLNTFGEKAERVLSFRKNGEKTFIPEDYWVASRINLPRRMVKKARMGAPVRGMPQMFEVSVASVRGVPKAPQMLGAPVKRQITLAPKFIERILQPQSLSKKETKLLPTNTSLISETRSRRLVCKRRAYLPTLSESHVVREYAFRIREDRKPGDRIDFSETVYWNAALITDEEGRTQCQFDLSDSVTSFHVLAGKFQSQFIHTKTDAINASAVMGIGDKLIVSKEPFYIESKIPLEVSSGDTIQVPISLVNSSSDDLNVKLNSSINGKALEIKTPEQALTIKSEGKERRLLDINVKNGNEKCDIIVKADAGAFHDSVTRSVRVVPRGFPMSLGHSGVLRGGESQRFQFSLPASIVPESLSTFLEFYMNPLGSLTSALTQLIKTPYGCFEQASSIVYPMVMAQQYFTSHASVDPNIIQNANKHLESGYKRLISYECINGGFSWFGGKTGWEGLTAYGILQFTDMSKVYPVDHQMLKRTINWLFSRRDGRGGFLRNSSSHGAFSHSPINLTNAYIVWALTEAGLSDKLNLEIKSIYDNALTEKDPYIVGLAAKVMINVKKMEEAEKLAEYIASKQVDKGYVDGAKTTICRSGGISKLIETTAIAILVWLQLGPKFVKNVELAMNWLHSNCRFGAFGSTQSSVLALKAIIEYDKRKAKPGKGNIQIFINDRPTNISAKFNENSKDTIKLPSFEHLLSKEGDYTLEIKLNGDATLPYSFGVEYNCTLPATSEECVFNLSTKLNKDIYEEGEGGEIQVHLKNKANESQGMSVAMIGIPGGMEPRHDQLKELVKGKIINAYEIIGRNVVLYFEEVDKSADIKLKVDVIARIPGIYEGPASCAFLYYTNEFKSWAPGVKVKIQPKIL